MRCTAFAGKTAVNRELATCEEVAADHRGVIAATSQPGQGTTFSVYLPV